MFIPNKKIITDSELDLENEQKLKENDFILMCPSTFREIKRVLY